MRENDYCKQVYDALVERGVDPDDIGDFYASTAFNDGLTVEEAVEDFFRD